MKNFTKKIFYTGTVLSFLLISLLTNSVHAQQYTFETIASQCERSGPMTTTINITGINVTTVNGWGGFIYEVVFNLKNDFTGTASGTFYTYQVGFQSSLPTSENAPVAFSNIVVPMSSTTTMNLKTGLNYFDGSSIVLPLGLTTDTAIIKKFKFNAATLTVGSDCYNAKDLSTNGVILPVKLVSFLTEKENTNSILTWTTALEQNNKGYEIQRSSDSKNWSKIGFISSAADFGNSSESISYSFTDQNPMDGANFYRLKQIDFDQNFQFSEVRKVIFGQGSVITFYPNPAKSVLNISGLESNQRIQLSNITGQTIKTIISDNELTSMDVSELSSGVYFILIQDSNGLVNSFKFVKSN